MSGQEKAFPYYMHNFDSAFNSVKASTWNKLSTDVRFCFYVFGAC